MRNAELHAFIELCSRGAPSAGPRRRTARAVVDSLEPRRLMASVLGTIYNDLNRPSQEIVDQFIEVLQEYSPSCLVTDARKRVGAIGGLLPVKPQHKIAGPALTVNLSIELDATD